MPERLRTLLPWLPYPAVMTLSFVLFAVLQSTGAPLQTSLYVPILVAAALVTGLELVFPHRREWQPETGEVRTDLAFMVIVQLALPPVVGFFFTYSLVEPARRLNLPIAWLWPHGWPLWVQAVVMILAVDFMRYWLHRALHRHEVLWRLHTVHHSVQQLYWLNTGRFHPLEKTLQLALDSLPFLLLQVDPRVLALYYLTYASNGFFQHSNVRLRYGFLNYIVGSAETHRWHHSAVPGEANTNYGSTLLVWDVLFGTWYLPHGREVAELGLHDPTYPKSFLTLLRAPFDR